MYRPRRAVNFFKTRNHKAYFTGFKFGFISLFWGENTDAIRSVVLSCRHYLKLVTFFRLPCLIALKTLRLGSYQTKNR